MEELTALTPEMPDDQNWQDLVDAKDVLIQKLQHEAKAWAVLAVGKDDLITAQNAEIHTLKFKVQTLEGILENAQSGLVAAFDSGFVAARNQLSEIPPNPYRKAT